MSNHIHSHQINKVTKNNRIDSRKKTQVHHAVPRTRHQRNAPRSQKRPARAHPGPRPANGFLSDEDAFGFYHVLSRGPLLRCCRLHQQFVFHF